MPLSMAWPKNGSRGARTVKARTPGVIPALSMSCSTVRAKSGFRARAARALVAHQVQSPRDSRADILSRAAQREARQIHAQRTAARTTWKSHQELDDGSRGSESA
eukprot:6199467-Pleurochrysis_carterae.AAC.1